MPNTKSAKKDMLKNIENRARNRAGRSVLRTAIRKVVDAVASADIPKAIESFNFANKKLDQAAAKGLIHRNNAARHKSRLSARIKALKTAKPA